MEITSIDQSNDKFFDPLMPSAIKKQADVFLGAVADDGTACAVLAADAEEMFFHLLWIYVAKDYRGQGMGRALFDAFVECAVLSGYDGIFCRYVNSKENEGLNKFLRACNFEDLAWEDFREGKDEEKEKEDDYGYGKIYVTAAADVKSSFLEQKESKGANFIALKDLPEYRWNSFEQRLLSAGNDISVVLRPPDEYDAECSFVLQKEEKICGCLLFSRSRNNYTLEYLTVDADTTPAQAMGLLAAGIRVIAARGDKDVPVIVNALTKVTEKLVLQITDGKAEFVGDAACRFYYF